MKEKSWQVKAFSLSLSLSLILLAFPAHAYHGIPVTIVGKTSPGALVNLKIPKLTISLPKLADENGNFIFTFDDIEPDVYIIKISAMKDGAANEMDQVFGVPTGVQAMTLSDIELPLFPVEPIQKEKADLNGDGRVNLIDLSILLYWWGSPIAERPYNEKVDLNSDGAVNLQDFSLVLTNWTN